MPTRGSHERRLRRAFSGPEARVFRSVQSTATLLLEDLAGILAEQGLTLSQYDALRVLHEAGEEGLRCRLLGERMMNRAPDVTRLLDRLERQGLVERERAREDRRAVVARLTPMGAEVLTAAAEPLARLHREQLGHLSVKTLETLARLLDRARQGGLPD